MLMPLLSKPKPSHNLTQLIFFGTFICPGDICPYQTQFWPNFKGIFLGPNLTDINCPGNIFLATLVHIRNISAITDIFLPYFFAGLNFLD